MTEKKDNKISARSQLYSGFERVKIPQDSSQAWTSGGDKIGNYLLDIVHNSLLNLLITIVLTKKGYETVKKTLQIIKYIENPHVLFVCPLANILKFCPLSPQ